MCPQALVWSALQVFCEQKLPLIQRKNPNHSSTSSIAVKRQCAAGLRSMFGQIPDCPPAADTCGCQAQPYPARCRRLRRSARWPWWWAWWCGPGLSLSRFTISWSLLPSTLGRKSEALSVLRVLKPRRGRPLPLMETYHCLLALARRLLLPPPPGAAGCSVEWWREA